MPVQTRGMEKPHPKNQAQNLPVAENMPSGAPEHSISRSIVQRQPYCLSFHRAFDTAVNGLPASLLQLEYC